MRQWLGDAPDWLVDQYRALEPAVKAHAEQFARAYFEQFKKSEQQLVRGPDANACFAAFTKDNTLPDWGEENRLYVEMAVLELYREYQDQEFHRLLLREML